MKTETKRKNLDEKIQIDENGREYILWPQGFEPGSIVGSNDFRPGSLTSRRRDYHTHWLIKVINYKK